MIRGINTSFYQIGWISFDTPLSFFAGSGRMTVDKWRKVERSIKLFLEKCDQYLTERNMILVKKLSK